MRKLLLLVVLTIVVMAEPYGILGGGYATSDEVFVKCRANSTIGAGYKFNDIISAEYRGRYGLSSDYYSQELLLKPTYSCTLCLSWS